MLNNLLINTLNQILFESQESDSQKLAKNLYQQRTGCTREEADKFVRVSLRNDITSLRNKQLGKFTLGVTRMFLDRELQNANDISNLNTILKLMLPHINEYDKNLNNLSLQELVQKFEQVRLENLENSKNEINNMSFGQSNYNIVRIDSYEQAQQYKQYTYSGSPWCLTYMEDMFDSYTCGGMNQIYFCLQNGFENIKPEVGANAPLDEYGLSMLCIIVNESGELAYCTSRWNHANGGDDSVMNVKEISQTVSVNFYNTFKPNNVWNELLQDALSRLQNGEDPKDIFNYVEDEKDGLRVIELKRKYNYLTSDNHFLCDEWYNDAGNFLNGFARVEKEGLGYNFINTEGKRITDEWYYGADNFKNGFAKVYKNDLGYNFINTEGKRINDEWYYGADNFKNGFAKVRKKGLGYNFIKSDGTYLTNDWYDWVENFENGFAKVRKKGLGYNFIKSDGTYLTNDWYDYARNFCEGFALVILNDEYNFINTNGKFISIQWYDYVWDFLEGFAKVQKEGLGWNFINTKGKRINNDWYDRVESFRNGFAKVNKKGVWYYLGTDGRLYDEHNQPIQESRKTYIINWF